MPRPRSRGSTTRSAASSSDWGSVWVEGEITSWNVRGGNVLRPAQGPRRGRDALLPHLVVDAAPPRRRPQGGRPRHRLRQGRLLRQAAATSPSRSRRCATSGSATSSSGSSGCARSCAREGLFDAARKKPLPFLPHCIGLITGEKSDAEKDVHPQRRAALAAGALPHRARGGAGRSAASPRRSAALQGARRRPRGRRHHRRPRRRRLRRPCSASATSALLRAVAAASTPVVSAIGHENDRPLLDDVADLRASTPTDAAKRVVPDVAEQRAARRAAARAPDRHAAHAAPHARHRPQLEQLRTRPALRIAGVDVDSPRAGAHAGYVARGREHRRARRSMPRDPRTPELRGQLRALSPAVRPSTAATRSRSCRTTSSSGMPPQAPAGAQLRRDGRRAGRSRRAPRARSSRAPTTSAEAGGRPSEPN